MCRPNSLGVGSTPLAKECDGVVAQRANRAPRTLDRPLATGNPVFQFEGVFHLAAELIRPVGPESSLDESRVVFGYEDGSGKSLEIRPHTTPLAPVRDVPCLQELSPQKIDVIATTTEFQPHASDDSRARSDIEQDDIESHQEVFVRPRSVADANDVSDRTAEFVTAEVCDPHVGQRRQERGECNDRRDNVLKLGWSPESVRRVSV